MVRSGIERVVNKSNRECETVHWPAAQENAMRTPVSMFTSRLTSAHAYDPDNRMLRRMETRKDLIHQMINDEAKVDVVVEELMHVYETPIDLLISREVRTGQGDWYEGEDYFIDGEEDEERFPSEALLEEEAYYAEEG